MANATTPIEQLANVNHHPLVKQKMSELRDKKTDSKRFRELVREIGALLGYEATKDLQLSNVPNVISWSSAYILKLNFYSALELWLVTLDMSLLRRSLWFPSFVPVSDLLIVN